MALIDEELRQRWQEQPDEPVALILRVEGDLTARSRALEALGVQVRRRHRLTPALSVQCPGRVALGLLDIAWVVRIEPDRPIKALGAGVGRH